MKYPKSIYLSLGIIIVILAAILTFMLGSITVKPHHYTKSVTSSNNTKISKNAAPHSSSTSSSSSQPHQIHLNYEELAMAAFIQNCNVDSIPQKINKVNEMIAGKTDNPNLDQPTAMQRQEDASIKIFQGKFGEAYLLVDFEGSQVNVTHYTHGLKDRKTAFSRQSLINTYGPDKQQLDNDIQEINANQQKFNFKVDDNYNSLNHEK